MTSRRPSRARSRHGLTLIELLAAATLAALMSVAALGVLGAMAERGRELTARRAPRGWQAPLARMLRDDLVQARTLIWTADSLALDGFGATDAASGAPLHRRALVVYTIRQIGQTSWLVRTQSSADDPLGRHDRSELVCAGVTEILLQSADNHTMARPPAGLRDVLPAKDALEPEAQLPDPERLVIVFYAAEQEEPLFEETIHCR